jgi:tetratricopeptide (TPR) repeat protein
VTRRCINSQVEGGGRGRSGLWHLTDEVASSLRVPARHFPVCNSALGAAGASKPHGLVARHFTLTSMARGATLLLICTLLTSRAASGLLALPQASTTSATARESQLLKQARQLMERKDFAEAARLYDQVLRFNPGSYEALNNLGVAEARQGNFSKAAKAYEQALRSHPNSFPLLLNLGLSYFKAQDFAAAISPLERAVAVQPDNSQARSVLGMAYYSERKYEPASRQFERVIAADPGNSTLQYVLAESYVRSGQNQKLLDFLQTMLENSPDSAALHMLKGEANDGLGRTREAIKEFEAAAALTPNQPNVHFGLGYLYWKERMYDKASDQFKLEIQNGGSVAKSEAYLGDIALKEGYLQEARSLLTRSERSFPTYAFTHYATGILLAQEKEYDSAAAEFRRAIELDPSRTDAHYRLAGVLRAQGKTEQAEEELKKVVQIQEKIRENLLHEVSGTVSSTPER